MAIVVAVPRPKRCLPARTKFVSLKRVDGAPGRAVTHPEEGPLAALNMRAAPADLGRLWCRKLQERRLPRDLPPRETRDVGLGIRFLPRKSLEIPHVRAPSAIVGAIIEDPSPCL